VDRIDLNADVGEHDHADGSDSRLVALVTSVSVACGIHAGSPAVMGEVVETALATGTAVGAHPSYPDRDGFGRRSMSISHRALLDSLVEQIGTLVDVSRERGATVRFVKPHGTLYNDMARDPALVAVVVAAVRAFGDLPVLVPAGSAAVAEVERGGLRAVEEGFADRAYHADGSLVPRDQPGAVLDDPAAVAGQAVSLARHGTVRSIDGVPITLSVQSICVHGDIPGAAGRAEAVRHALAAAGIGVEPFAQ